MKVTDAEIAEYFDVSPRTLGDWKKLREKRYVALKWSYMVVKHHGQICEAKDALKELADKEKGR